MWLEMVIDVFSPSRGPESVERILDKKLTPSGTIPVEFRRPGEFRRRLNESGWLADEVIAAGVVRQGKPPSVLGLITGLALIELARPRRSKSLPREFTLAVTAERVVAFAMSPWRTGDGDTDYVVYIKPDERGSWPRESVRMIDPPTGGKLKGGTLELAGLEQFPVTWDGDDSTDELIELLSR
jgi:hypothetical protein